MLEEFLQAGERGDVVTPLTAKVPIRSTVLQRGRLVMYEYRAGVGGIFEAFLRLFAHAPGYTNSKIGSLSLSLYAPQYRVGNQVMTVASCDL